MWVQFRLYHSIYTETIPKFNDLSVTIILYTNFDCQFKNLLTFLSFQHILTGKDAESNIKLHQTSERFC